LAGSSNKKRAGIVIELKYAIADKMILKRVFKINDLKINILIKIMISDLIFK
jgi:hypothetical protein